MRRFIIVLIALMASLSLNAQDYATIGRYMTFYSGILGGEVSFLVHLPEGYESSGIDYPVVYMMNGQSLTSFANAAATIDNLSNDRIPDMILIGISNTGVAASHGICPDDSGNLKRGDVFIKFFREDLLPVIKRSYRTNDYRILFGQSNAGLFVLYNYLAQSDLFNAYVVASPMLGRCPQFYLEKTKALLNNKPSPHRKLYLCYGDLDYVEVLRYMTAFIGILKESPLFPGYVAVMIENTGHVPYITLNNALLYFFSGCTITDDMKRLSIPEIKAHFEKLSIEYGFTVVPKAGILFDMAIDKKNEKEFGHAIGLFKYLISLYPGNEIYHYFLGQTYVQQGDVCDARECFEEALRINPEFIQAKSALDKI